MTVADVAVVAGRVRDRSGAPLAGVRVAFADAPVPVPDLAALTGADGRFALGAPAPGRYALVLAGERGTTLDVSVDVPDGDDAVVLEMTLDEAGP